MTETNGFYLHAADVRQRPFAAGKKILKNTMNALARFTLSSRAFTIAPRSLTKTSIGSSRMLSIASDLSKKERVEEERYIRQKEHEAYLVRKSQQDAADSARELTASETAAKEQRDAITSEIFAILSRSGDKVSDACIEDLADWKIGK